MKLSPLPFGCSAVLISAGFLFIAGCRSPAIPRDLMAEEARAENADRPIAMKGDATLLDGNVHVVATIARGFSRGPNKGGPIPAHRRGWLNKDTDPFDENFSFDYGDSEKEQREAYQAYIRQAQARRAAGSPMPPVTLHVTFENKGTAPMEIVPLEVNSDLGNFAVRPAKLTLAPGEKGSLDPMISQLGVMSDEIPLTVGVRAAGKSETKIILVKNILAASLRGEPTK